MEYAKQQTSKFCFVAAYWLCASNLCRTVGLVFLAFDHVVGFSRFAVTLADFRLLKRRVSSARDFKFKRILIPAVKGICESAMQFGTVCIPNATRASESA